jgi:diguanylate cyclase (GGDEF)-like protein
MKRPWVQIAVLCALPAITLCLAASYQYWSAFESETWFHGFVTLITGCAALVSILAIALCVYVVFDRRRIDADPAARAAEKRAGTLQIRLAEQSKEVEILSAMREVGLIVSREVDLEKILADVLEVIEGVFASSTMTIFLAKEDAGETALAPKAHRFDGATVFGGEIPADVDRTGADKAFAECMPVTMLRDGELDCAFPLVADGEILGVLKVVVPVERGEDGRAVELEKKLVKLVKHVALAIKTPTLYDRAVVDALTRLFTKRHFTGELARLFGQSARTAQPLGLIMIDIDHFKKINDTHGHLSGDIILAGVAEIVKSTVRRYDTAYRYGGEEMAVLLPEAGISEVTGVAKRIRKEIEEKEFLSDVNKKVAVTVSCGTASYIESMKKPEDLVKAADDALYKAKKAGRNRVVEAGGKKKQDGVSI